MIRVGGFCIGGCTLMSNKNYPIWWDKTITIYNKFEDSQTQVVKWYKHTVSQCFYKSISDKILVGNTVLESNNIICRIPKQADFLARHDWINTPNDEMQNYFTLGVGDIIINASVDDDIDEYKQGKRSTDLLAKYKSLQGCFEIQEIAINTGIGRCLEHYYVKGA